MSQDLSEPATIPAQTTVPIKLIKCVNRARVDFSDLEKLAESIKKHGLIHPVCVRPEQDGTYTLVAGECRLRAHLMAGMAHIPVTFKESISDIELKEMELEENLRRKDFHWTETTRALKQLDDLKKAQHGVAVGGRYAQPNQTGWSTEKTAELVGMSNASVSLDLKLAKDLESNPEIAAKVVHLPKTMARKQVETLLKEKELKAKVVSRNLNITSDLLLGDCVELIKTIPDNSISLLITDPPFACDTMNQVGKKLSCQYSENIGNMGEKEQMKALYKALFPELARVLKPGSHAYIFHAMEWYTELHKMLQDCGFIVDDMPLIWAKGQTTALPKDYHYVPSYEAITFAIKLPRSRPVLRPCANVLQYSIVNPKERVHPLQKPLELLKVFINNSSSLGETVLDPFAGSGSVLMAARSLQRKAVGFENNEGNFLRAQEWLNKGN